MESANLRNMRLIAIFCHVAKAGTMKAAAKELAMSAPAVSQFITQLENSLNTKLIHRSTRKLSLTDAGHIYFKYGSKMLQAASDAQTALEQLQQSVSGEVKISAPIGLAGKPLSQALAPVLKDNPGISLNIMAHDERINLIEQKIDLAIRVGQPNEQEYILHKLAPHKAILVASPTYMSQTPRLPNPNQLNHHQWIGSQSLKREGLTLQHANLESVQVMPIVHYQCNSITTRIELTLSDMGISCMPQSEVQTYLDSGELIQLLPEWSLPDDDIYALTPQRNTPKKVQVILAGLRDYFHFS